MSNRWFGSIDNRLMENCRQPVPVVGMGATELCYSDRHPYEIIEVIDDRHIIVRALSWKRTDRNGMSESQSYLYFSNPANPTAKLFLTKQGQWRERYPDRSLGCNRFALGFAERYYDPCF